MYNDIFFRDDIMQSQVGDLVLIADDDAIRQSIFIRLKTPKGSNVFHPEYGNEVYNILSDSIDEDWISRAASMVKECVEQDSNIKVVNIQSEVVLESRLVRLNIRYQVENSGSTYLLVWGENIE